VVTTSDVKKILAFVNPGFWMPEETIARIGMGTTASGSADTVTVSSGSSDSSGGVTQAVSGAVSGTVDVLRALADAVLVKVQSLWATGDIIAEGIRKTYYSVASAFDWEFDLGIMVENWLTREITISPTADDASRSLFSGSGAQAAKESKLDLAENGNYLATYGVDSTRGEIMLSGSATISGGEAKIFFDFSFTSVISDKVPLKVFVTPTTNMQGQLYVAQKSVYGFVVKSLNGPGDGQFDWLVIARRRGYEGAVAGEAPSTNNQIPNNNQTPNSNTQITNNNQEPINNNQTTEPVVTESPAPTASSSEPLISPEPSPEPTPTASPTPVVETGEAVTTAPDGASSTTEQSPEPSL
ncbi:MAG: hypothetical protein ACK4NX_01775, partial [Candidatus Paceibacteria bacterium]